MLVYLEHKDHGTHIVYSEAEKVECLKNGWTEKVEKPVKKAVKKKARK